MLLIQKTLSEFGHDPEKLSRGSDKRVLVSCDYCGKEFNLKNNARSNALKSLPKDACKGCGAKKRNEALLLKYGTKCTLTLKDAKEKRQKTWNDKYGGHPFNSAEVQEKIKETCVQRYGVENALKNDDIKEKIRQTNIKKFGVDNPFKLKEIQDKLRETQKKNGVIKVHKDKTYKEWAEKLGLAYSSFAERVRKYGFEIATSEMRQTSMLEQSMMKVLNDCNIKYTHQHKVDKYISDFYIPEFNLLIECDGLYWHSEMNVDNYYHFRKKDKYNELGFRSVFFREDEIRDKLPIVQSMILHRLNRSNRVYARKCSIEEIDHDKATDFFNTNHLMGKGRGKTYGLIYNSDLVSAVQLHTRTTGMTEISRFASKLNTSVIGGFTRLYSFFHPMCERVSTFIDRRYGVGNYLSELGLKLKKCSPSFKWTDGNTTIHRLNFPGNTGYEHGLFKIWDCGQASFS